MQNPNTRQVLTFKVEDKKDEKRLDVFLEEKLEISRSKAKKMIESGFIYIDNVPARKPGQKLRIGQVVRATILEEKEEPPKPIEIEIPVIYNDENIAVIAKPAGIVVHPAHGHKNDTLVNALFSMFEKLSLEGGLERAGIVHRLDKETSGLMVIAKEESCHRALTEMFKERIVKKVYIAIATGNPSLREGIIEKPIGRHPIDRKKMAITEKGRYALTAFKIVKEKSPYYLVLAKPVTGRTHQIRVHLKSIGIPLLGDPIYGKTNEKIIQRVALHSMFLSFIHPVNKKELSFFLPPPDDFTEAMIKLDLYLDEEELKSHIYKFISQNLYR